MDYVERHNEKAVVSRMKRLVERMHQDNAQVFKELGIAFEPRWFLIFSLLDEFGAMAVMDVARALNIKHPTVNVMVAELIKKGYVEDHIDAQDKRKRLLSLSPMGQRMIVDLKPLWNDMAAAAQELIEETGYDVIDVLASLERALDRESYYERQRRHILQRQWQTIVIRPYWDGDQPAFRDLNSAWIAWKMSLRLAISSP